MVCRIELKLASREEEKARLEGGEMTFTSRMACARACVCVCIIVGYNLSTSIHRRMSNRSRQCVR